MNRFITRRLSVFIWSLQCEVDQGRAWINEFQRWPLILTASIVWGIAIWQIYRTEFLAGFWGITNDEIAVITIEKNNNSSGGTSTENIIIQDPSKSFWDGLQLLGVPLVLAVLGAWFQKSQQEQAEQTAREQREQDADEAREEVLQLYFDRISSLLVDKNLMAIAAKETPASLMNENLKALEAKGTRTPEEQTLLDAALAIIQDRTVEHSSSEKRTPEQQELLDAALDVIRARTLSILRRFECDRTRKSSVIRFLAEAEIISKLKLDLKGADLQGVLLIKANLYGAKLQEADLQGAELIKATLYGAELYGAKLTKADVQGANLYGANLTKADIKWANLIDAYLVDAKFYGADIRWTDLQGANLYGANLIDANLRNADLQQADLQGADIRWTDLQGADLQGADLERADLCGANLCGANLLWADLQRTLLVGTDLTNIKFNTKTIWPAKSRVAEAKNIPIELQQQLGLIPQTAKEQLSNQPPPEESQ